MNRFRSNDRPNKLSHEKLELIFIFNWPFFCRVEYSFGQSGFAGIGSQWVKMTSLILEFIEAEQYKAYGKTQSGFSEVIYILVIWNDRYFKCFMLIEPLKWNLFDLVNINAYLKQTYRMSKVFL